jgi:hypothetical protein
MWLEKFIKKQFISFYKEEEYKVILQEVKNKKILFTEEKIFEEKKEFLSFIKEKINQTPQTYVSTVLLTFNQGVIPSCKKEEFIKKEIDPNNVKTICINNKYAFYVSVNELEKIKKEYPFLDFIYSIFAIIDFVATERKNRFYLLVLQNHLVILGYENFIPIYHDIQSINIEEDEEFEIVEDIDLEDELINDISPFEEEKEKKEEVIEPQKITVEMEILEHLKNSIKEYYEHYSSDFIEKIIILDTTALDITITSLIEEEILIPCELKQFDLLNSINRLSIESV